MVDVDDELVYPGNLQPRDDVPEKRFATDWDQGFGKSVGNRFQAGAKTRREYHCFHRTFSIPSSR